MDAEHPILELIRRRATVERFDPDRGLDEQAIRELVSEATRAPSSFNIQHWRFVAVRRPEDKQRLFEAVSRSNVIAFFHGHYHASGRYVHEGYDVYNVGAAKHRRYSFAVVKVTDTRLRVASFHHGLGRFQWWHDKPINNAPGKVIAGGIHASKGLLLENELLKLRAEEP